MAENGSESFWLLWITLQWSGSREGRQNGLVWPADQGYEYDTPPHCHLLEVVTLCLGGWLRIPRQEQKKWERLQLRSKWMTSNLYWGNTATCCFQSHEKNTHSSRQECMSLPYFSIKSFSCIICEKPVLSSKLSQLNPAEVGAVSSQACWNC